MSVVIRGRPNLLCRFQESEVARIIHSLDLTSSRLVAVSQTAAYQLCLYGTVRDRQLLSGFNLESTKLVDDPFEPARNLLRSWFGSNTCGLLLHNNGRIAGSERCIYATAPVLGRWLFMFGVYLVCILYFTAVLKSWSRYFCGVAQRTM